MTYRQASEKGWQVRKGEKSSNIDFWEVGRGKDGEGESDADKPRSRMIHRVYSVFNVDQIDGVLILKLNRASPSKLLRRAKRFLPSPAPTSVTAVTALLHAFRRLHPASAQGTVR